MAGSQEYEETLKSTLKIKKEYVKSAQKKLLKVEKHRRNMLNIKTHTNIQTNVGNNTGTNNEITFVGVHNRRSDHIEFMRERLKLEPLSKKFFSAAFEYFRYVFLVGGLSLGIMIYSVIPTDVSK